MATIQEATQNAMNFAQQALGVERARGLLLEEVESAKEGSDEVWRITLSMPDPSPVNALNAMALLGGRRQYKTFSVVKLTGEVKSMKIREISER
jgi:hypothetical protein